MIVLVALLACGGSDPESPTPTTPADTDTDTGCATVGDSTPSVGPTAHTGGSSPTADTASSPTVQPIDVQIEVDPLLPTVVHVSWSTTDDTVGHVVYDQGGDPRQTPSTPLSTTHEISVLGLKAGHDVTLHVVSESDDARGSSAPTTLSLAPAPADLQPAVLTTSDPSRQTAPDGFVALNYRNGQSYTVILDMDGDPVWWVAADPRQQVTTVKPARDGRSLLFNVHNMDDYLLPGGIHRVSLDGRDRAYTEARWAHHDYQQLPDGSMAWIAYALGDGTIDGQTLPIAADAIWEGPEGAVHGTTKVFDVLEDYPHDPYMVCDHLELSRYVEGYHEWTHSNSLMYDEADDAYYMMSKTLDALFKIDRATGELVWQLGGRDDEFTLVGDGMIFDHSHMSHVWTGGFAVFDNRVHTPPKVSRAVAYEVDEANRTVEQVWEFVEPSGGFTGRLGDVRKLDSGNYLVAWGGLGRVSEITADGEVVWEVSVGGGVNTGRARLLPDLYALPAP
jgi:hypothetical protein